MKSSQINSSEEMRCYKGDASFGGSLVQLGISNVIPKVPLDQWPTAMNFGYCTKEQQGRPRTAVMPPSLRLARRGSWFTEAKTFDVLLLSFYAVRSTLK